MALPSTFVFSQASLQDYADCPRRFQLRYLLDVRWPAAQDDSILEWEQRTRQGSAFHRLVHQHTTGIPVTALDAVADKSGVRLWWQAYLATPPRDLPTAVRHSEVRLSMLLNKRRIAARYDLLALEPGARAAIVDWKTSRTRPRRDWLERRLQTWVYRYVLVEAGAQLNGGQALAPEQVELVYWFANYPLQVERFAYSAEQHDEAGHTISATIAEIDGLDRAEWSLTSDLRRCRYCPYRSLCEREAVEAEAEEIETEEEDLFDIDLEQIAEIEF